MIIVILQNQQDQGMNDVDHTQAEGFYSFLYTDYEKNSLSWNIRCNTGRLPFIAHYYCLEKFKTSR